MKGLSEKSLGGPAGASRSYSGRENAEDKGIDTAVPHVGSADCRMN